MKRLIFCFDGTWNKLDAPNPTNVVITAESVVPVTHDGIVQQIFYHEGVGTNKYDRFIGGVFGVGVVPNIADAYRTLIFNYTAGDEIFVFGFSRGAYSARSFVGLIGTVGILSRSDAGQVDAAVDHYRKRDTSDNFRASMCDYRSKYSSEVCISADDDDWRVKNCTGYVTGAAHLLRLKYLGVWDTVGALGIPVRYRLLSPLNWSLQFHDVSLSPLVENARHAVAIDERRKDFAPSLWDNLDQLNAAAGSSSSAFDAPYQQQWFPGTHSSVGGGGDRRGLSDYALDWIYEGAQRAGLQLDKSARTPIYRLQPDYREYLQDSTKPGLMYRVMNSVAAGDRDNGPKSLSEVSISAKRRWKEKADNLLDGIEYRPKTLASVAKGLEELIAADLGVGIASPEEGSFRLYQVKPRDGLRKIAAEQLGSASRETEIFQMNRDKIDNPDRIFAGQFLRLPKA